MFLSFCLSYRYVSFFLSLPQAGSLHWTAVDWKALVMSGKEMRALCEESRWKKPEPEGAAGVSDPRRGGGGPECVGPLFTLNPSTGKDEYPRMFHGDWQLGRILWIGGMRQHLCAGAWGMAEFATTDLQDEKGNGPMSQLTAVVAVPHLAAHQTNPSASAATERLQHVADAALTSREDAIRACAGERGGMPLLCIPLTAWLVDLKGCCAASVSAGEDDLQLAMYQRVKQLHDTFVNEHDNEGNENENGSDRGER
jgi:hypothetical protein